MNKQKVTISKIRKEFQITPVLDKQFRWHQKLWKGTTRLFTPPLSLQLYKYTHIIRLCSEQKLF